MSELELLVSSRKLDIFFCICMDREVVYADGREVSDQSCWCCVCRMGVPLVLFAVVIDNRTDPGSAELNWSISHSQNVPPVVSSKSAEGLWTAQCAQFLLLLLSAQWKTTIKIPFSIIAIYRSRFSGEMISLSPICSWVLMTNEAAPSGLLYVQASSKASFRGGERSDAFLWLRGNKAT